MKFDFWISYPYHEDMRTCTDCGESKPLDAYYTMLDRHGKTKTYYQKRCKKCVIAKNKARYTKEQIRDQMLWAKYKIRLVDFDALLIKQDNKCAICSTSIDHATAQVDHDHSCCTGRYACGKCNRGLLCGQCNRMLAQGRDDPDIFTAALSYLSQSSKK